MSKSSTWFHFPPPFPPLGKYSLSLLFEQLFQISIMNSLNFLNLQKIERAQFPVAKKSHQLLVLKIKEVRNQYILATTTIF